MAKKNEIVKVEKEQLSTTNHIENLIVDVRGKQTMLDRDLAMLYGVDTKVLNQAVKRNINRFPEHFRFQLTDMETNELVTNCDRLRMLKHSSVNPFVFTEQGVAMLSTVLHSETAISVSIQIMDAFTTMRHFITSHAQAFQRLEIIERNQLALNVHLAENDKKFEEVFRRLDEGAAAPKEAIFFDGEFFEARVLLEKLIKMAKKRVIIIDGYIDAATFDMLDIRAKGVTADIYSDGEHKSLRDTHNASKGKQPINTHKWSNSSHDRWIIVDDTLYHCGHSVKDLGKKLSAIMRMDWNPDVVLNAVK